MSIRKSVARFLILTCGLKRLHGSALQRTLRSILDEIDLQNFRETYAGPSMKDRDEMFGYVHENGASGAPITYLEFGVYTGESIRKWAGLSGNRESRFIGFDSFEGLPSDWNRKRGKGYFDVHGSIPEIDDDRVSFIKGWFNETVPEFARNFNPQNRLVIHLDADLYSSTMIPLIYLDRFMQKGTLLLFDEFYDRNHEYKAWVDYQTIARRSFRTVCHIDNYSKVCIEITADSKREEACEKDEPVDGVML